MNDMKTILLVEDEAIIAVSEKMILEKYGYVVLNAEDSSEALQVFSETPSIDLVLMDIDLGDGPDGTETAKLLLEKKDVPIIFLSSYTSSEIVDKTKDISSYGYVVKNSGPTVLDASIKMAFRLFDATKKLEIEKEHLKTTLNSIGDAVIATDLDGIITGMNPIAKVLTGWSVEEAIGKPVTDVFKIVNADTREEVENPVTKIIQNGMGVDHASQTLLLSRDGTEYQIGHSGAPIKTNNGKSTGVVLVFRDETEKHKNEKTIQNLIDNNPLSIQIVDEEGYTVSVNPSHTKLFGAVPPRDYSVFKDAQLEKQGFSDLMKKVTKGEVVRFPDFQYNIHEVFPDFPDSPVWIRVYAFPLSPVNGKIQRYVLIHENITEQKRIEHVLQESEEKFSQAFESGSNLMIISNAETGRFIDVNNMFLQEMEYTKEEVIGKTSKELHVYQDYNQRNLLQNIIAQDGFAKNIEINLMTKTGKVLYGLFSVSTVKIGEENCWIITMTDISDRKIAEEKIKTLLAEKELILKEVHHRIKNNMSTVTSILSLHASTLEDPKAIEALEDAGNRVQSMMALYTKLYQSVDFNTLSLSLYLPYLVDEIIENFPNAKCISVEKNIEDIVLDVKRLQPLGIIINELLTNSMKYAFPDMKSGKIMVSATLKENHVTIIIADNGVGMSDSITFENSNGFGLMLVNGLIAQIKGTMRIEHSNGTQSIIEFNL